MYRKISNNNTRIYEIYLRASFQNARYIFPFPSISSSISSQFITIFRYSSTIDSSYYASLYIRQYHHRSRAISHGFKKKFTHKSSSSLATSQNLRNKQSNTNTRQIYKPNLSRWHTRSFKKKMGRRSLKDRVLG